MIDLSTLDTPDGCPFISAPEFNQARLFVFSRNDDGSVIIGTELARCTDYERFIICATMTAWLDAEGMAAGMSGNFALAGELEDMGMKWFKARAEAYAAIKEQRK